MGLVQLPGLLSFRGTRRVAGDVVCCAVLVAAAFGSAPSPLEAQASGSFNRHGSGARAAGMGNAFVAVSDDGTAFAWNPAGLAQLRKPEVSLVLSSIGRRVDLEGFRSLDDRFTFTPYRDSDGAQFIDFASLAIPVTIGRPVTFQVGWRRLYSLETSMEGTFRREPTPLAVDEPVTEIFNSLQGRGSVDLVSFATAMRVTRRLSLGVSVDVWRGNWRFEEVTRQREAGGSPEFLESSQDQGIDDSVNLNVGMMLHLSSWRFGAVYHAAVSSGFRGTRTLESTLPPPGLSVAETLPQGAESQFPESFGIGVSWKPEPRWTVALDVAHDRWKEWTLSGIPGTSEPINFSDNRPVDRTSTRNTTSLSTGAEWILQKQGFVVPFRVGFSYEPQGPRDPMLFTSYAMKLLSCGLGYNTNSFKLDFAVQHGWFDHRQTESISIESNLGNRGGFVALPDAVGLRQERFWRLKLSAIVRIADTEKLKRTLGQIFGGS